MGKYDNKIKKDKENNEPFDLEKYINDIELYRKQRKVLDLFTILDKIEKEMVRLIIRLVKAPEIRVRLVELEAKPKEKNKMKIEWIK